MEGLEERRGEVVHGEKDTWGHGWMLPRVATANSSVSPSSLVVTSVHDEYSTVTTTALPRWAVSRRARHQGVPLRRVEEPPRKDDALISIVLTACAWRSLYSYYHHSPCGCVQLSHRFPCLSITPARREQRSNCKSPPPTAACHRPADWVWPRLLRGISVISVIPVTISPIPRPLLGTNVRRYHRHRPVGQKRASVRSGTSAKQGTTLYQLQTNPIARQP